MRKLKFVPAAVAALLATSAAHASVDLIAIGSIDAHGGDLAPQTAAPLENGAPGNLFGGLGSGLTYAGCDTFLAVPDRGPNAISYNAAADNTTSYVVRFQTLQLKLAPATSGTLPFSLTPALTNTTLLSALQPLVYGDGASVGLPSGVPALNTNRKRNYFTGRSDNFAANQVSTYPLNGRFDPESIRVSNDGGTVFISDEYGPHIYAFNRATGERVWSLNIPTPFAVPYSYPVGDTEISGNTVGRVANKGMEGLAISPDGKVLYGVMQSPLIQDGGTNAAYTRILKIDLTSGISTQIVYPLTNIGSSSKPKYPTVSEIIAVNDHQFLVDERDGKGMGDNSTAVFKMVYLIDISGAKDASAVSGAATLAGYAVPKTPFLDIVSKLTAHGLSANDIPAKLEGLAFGPDVLSGTTTLHTLFVSNDNDFIPTVTDSNHPNGIENPNQFFVFAFSDADLPGFVPQQLSEKACK